METDIERNEKRSKGKARSATLEDEEDQAEGNARSATISNERNAQLGVSRRTKHLSDVHPTTDKGCNNSDNKKIRSDTSFKGIEELALI